MMFFFFGQGSAAGFGSAVEESGSEGERVGGSRIEEGWERVSRQEEVGLCSRWRGACR